MEAILYAPFILLAVGYLVYIVLQVRRDRMRAHRSRQYVRWVRDLEAAGPEAVQAAMPHILERMQNPNHRGPWESLKL